MVKSAEKRSTPSKRKRLDIPRKPSRSHGRARYAVLLAATEKLLESENPDSIGLYEIAAKAKIPNASIYHFFPSREAAYVALAQRYMDELDAAHRIPIEAALIQSWQDLYRIDVRRAYEFYNRRKPAMKILYGGYGGVEARNIDTIFTLEIARCQYDRLNSIFHMPHIPDPEHFFEIRTAILDAIWSVSVRRYGYITERHFEESLDACMSYTAQYLPRRIQRRANLEAAAARGDLITLPITRRAEAPAAPVAMDQPGAGRPATS